MNSVQIRCLTKDNADLASLKPFQGSLKNLSKANYQKLKNQIVTQGFSFPVFVWVCDGVNYLLDGHQRTRVLSKMKKEGWQIPPIPIVKVEAADYMEAKQKLLSATSQYGEIQGEGLYEFITDAGLTPDYLLENLRLPEIDLESFTAEFYDAGEDEDDAKDDGPKPPKTCPHCGLEL